MSKSKIEYDPNFTPKYEPDYKLHDDEINDALRELGIPSEHVIVSMLDPNLKSFYLEPIIDSEVNKDKNNFTIYFILNKGKNHWVWMKANFDKKQNSVSAYIEDSMSFYDKNKQVKFLNTLLNSINNGNKTFKVESIRAVATGQQTDPWTCGYRAIAGMLKDYLEFNKKKQSEVENKVTNFSNNEELRNDLLGLVFKHASQKIQANASVIFDKLKDAITDKNELGINKAVNELVRILKNINDLRMKSLKIYKKDVDFKTEIAKVIDDLKQLQEKGLYNILDAVMDGRINRNYVEALTFCDIINIQEIFGTKPHRMTNYQDVKDENTLVIYKCKDKNELIIQFPNEKKLKEFQNKVPKSKFVARDPQTGQFIDEKKELTITTVDSRQSTASIYCPTYIPKGASTFATNLGDNTTVEAFIKTLGLLKKEPVVYQNGQTKFTIALLDGTPLFKYYEGKKNTGSNSLFKSHEKVDGPSDKSQVNALYCHENSPLIQDGTYIKLNTKEVILGQLLPGEKFKEALEGKSDIDSMLNTVSSAPGI